MTLASELYKIALGIVLIMIGIGVILNGMYMMGPNDGWINPYFGQILLGIIIIILGRGIARKGSREGNNYEAETNNNNLPSLVVSCKVIDDEGVEQTIETTIKSNDMVEAEKIFKQSCAEKNYKLLDDPSISIEPNKLPDKDLY